MKPPYCCTKAQDMACDSDLTWWKIVQNGERMVCCVWKLLATLVYRSSVVVALN